MSRFKFISSKSAFPLLITSCLAWGGAATANEGMWKISYIIDGLTYHNRVVANIRYGCKETSPGVLTTHEHIVRHDTLRGWYDKTSTIDIASYDGYTFFTEVQNSWESKPHFYKATGFRFKQAEINCEHYAQIEKASSVVRDPSRIWWQDYADFNATEDQVSTYGHVYSHIEKISDTYDIYQLINGFGTQDPKKNPPSGIGSALTASPSALQAQAIRQVIRQVTGEGLARDMQSGLRIADFAGKGATGRLASLSSQLSITNGLAALDRAGLGGNLAQAAQSARSLANQSLDAGSAGIWVALSSNEAITGTHHSGSSDHYQIGQDFALNPEFTIGVAASNSDIAEQWNGDLPSRLSGTALGADFYVNYRPDRLRLSAQSGAQTGTMQHLRILSAIDNEMTLGNSGFHGADGELRLGYELGQTNATSGQNFSLIPNLAVGYRTRQVAAYTERATSDDLALAIPELAQKQAYAGMGFEARLVLRGKDIAALPRLSVNLGREKSRLAEHGVASLASDPDLQIDRPFGGASYRSVARIGAGIDVIGSGDSLALRADYQGSFAKDEKSNAVTFGLKGAF